MVKVWYSARAAGEYEVWRNANERIGVVKKIGFRWLAISSAHRSLGSFTTMSQAGERLAEEMTKK